MKFILTFLTISMSSFAFGQNLAKRSTVGEVDQYINRHYNNAKFNGNLLITKGDSILYSNSFGFANRELDVRHTDSTKFLIGSITKPFTALAILILEKEAKLKLSDRLSKYFPHFESADKITIDQLLSHTSGIADYRMFADWKEDSKSDSTSPQTTVLKMRKQPLLFKPGEKFSYSNVGYILLGLIIEKVSEQAFAVFIQEKILNPLHLKNTGVINNKSLIFNLASGYSTNPRETIKAEYINYKQAFTSGNMYSTVNDLWEFTKAVMQAKLISAEKTKQIFESGKHYGYGWGIRSFEGLKAYGHYGGMNGFAGAITFLAEGEYFICLLTNDNNTPKVRITNDLVSIISGKTVPAPVKTNLIDLSSEISKKVCGNYLVKAGDTLSVFENNNVLYLQENGQAKHEMFPYGDYGFSFELLEFNAVFEELKNGKTQRLKFVGGKTILEAKRLVEPFNN